MTTTVMNSCEDTYNCDNDFSEKTSKSLSVVSASIQTGFQKQENMNENFNFDTAQLSIFGDDQ